LLLLVVVVVGRQIPQREVEAVVLVDLELEQDYLLLRETPTQLPWVVVALKE
jgi:hypothetical protein